MKTTPAVSVIIPTFNRKEFLCDALVSLTQQSFPTRHFEVIVIDDGSTDGTGEIAAESYPYRLRYFWQANQGDAAARNRGAKESEADILVFLDDDILVEPEYLSCLIETLEFSQDKVVVGLCQIWPGIGTPPALDDAAHSAALAQGTVTEIHFAEVFSNNMSISREAYSAIGTMRGLGFPGSDMWCDLEFSYRALKQGFKFLRNNSAHCWHRDHSSSNLDVHKKRMKTASYRSILLFQEYPDLLPQVPMFTDKTPIVWGRDPAPLVFRKLIRSLTSSRPALWSMEKIAHAFQKSDQSPLLSSLYRWIIGGYIFRGFREGLRDFGPLKV